MLKGQKMEQIPFFPCKSSFLGFPTCCTAIKLSAFKILIFGAGDFSLFCFICFTFTNKESHQLEYQNLSEPDAGVFSIAVVVVLL